MSGNDGDVLEEIRGVREKIEETIRDRPEEFLRRLDELECRYKDRLVHRKPKFAQSKAA